MMYAAVRLRGEVGIDQEIEDTLKMLNLKKKFNCTLLPETEDYKGMLKKVKNFVTWGKVNEKNAKKVLDKNDIENVDDIIEGLEDDKSLGKMEVSRTFPLSPPSGGFKKSTKDLHPNGEAGKREEGINELLERMV